MSTVRSPRQNLCPNNAIQHLRRRGAEHSAAVPKEISERLNVFRSFSGRNKCMQNDGHHLPIMDQHRVFIKLLKILKIRIISLVFLLKWSRHAHWHTPKFLVRPTWGSMYVKLQKVGTWSHSRLRALKGGRGALTRSQVTRWNPLEGFTKSSCGKLRLGSTFPASNSRKGWRVELGAHGLD